MGSFFLYFGSQSVLEIEYSIKEAYLLYRSLGNSIHKLFSSEWKYIKLAKKKIVQSLLIANALNSIYVMLQHFFFLVFEFGSVANLSTQYLVDELNNKIYKVIRCNCIGFPAPKNNQIMETQ